MAFVLFVMGLMQRMRSMHHIGVVCSTNVEIWRLNLGRRHHIVQTPLYIQILRESRAGTACDQKLHKCN